MSLWGTIVSASKNAVENYAGYLGSPGVADGTAGRLTPLKASEFPQYANEVSSTVKTAIEPVIKAAAYPIGALAAGAVANETTNPYASAVNPQRAATYSAPQNYNPQAIQESGLANIGALTDVAMTPVQLVQHGLTAGMLAADYATGGGQLTDAHKTLKDVWSASRYLSPGQEVVASANRFFGDQGASSPREQVNRAIAMNSELTYVDGNGILQHGFMNNYFANFISGTTDASTYLLDPLIWVGKGASVFADHNFYRTATGSDKKIFGKFSPVWYQARAPKLAQEAKNFASGNANSGIGAQLQNIVGKAADGSERMNLAQIRSLVGEDGWKATNPDELAGAMDLFIKVGGTEAVNATPQQLIGHLVAAQLGDQTSREFLQSNAQILTEALQRAANPIAEAPAVTKELWDQYLLADKGMAKALGESSGFVGTGFNLSLIGAEMGPKNKYLANIYADMARVRGDISIGGKPKILDNPTSYEASRQKTDGSWVVDKYQISPLARTIAIARHVGQVRPANFIVFKGTNIADGAKEIQAAAYDIKGWTPAERLSWMENYQLAITETEKRDFARQFNEARVRSTLRDELGYEGESLDNAVNKLLGKQQEVVDATKQNGYYIADDGVTIVHDALLLAQLDAGYPLLDVSYIRKFHKYDPIAFNELGVLGKVNRASGVAVNRSIEATNFLIDNLWKPSILLRGGFAPRNISESYGRLAGLGVLTQMAAQIGPEGMHAWAKNRLAGVNSLYVNAKHGVSFATDAEKIAANARVANPEYSATGTLKVVEKNGQLRLVPEEKKGTPVLTMSDMYNPEHAADVRSVISAEKTTQRALRPDEKVNSAKITWGDPIDPPVLDEAGIAANTVSRQRAEKQLDKNLKYYFDSYSRDVQQIIGDPIARRLIKGEDRNQLLNWFTSSNRDAVNLRKKYGLGYHLEPGQQATVEQAVDKFLEIERQVQKHITGTPGTKWSGLPQEIIDQLFSKTFSGEEFRNIIQDPELIGTIHGIRVEEVVSNNTAVAALQKTRKVTVDYLFKKIGSDLEDSLVRLPFGAMSFRNRSQEILNALQKQGTDVSKLTEAEVADLTRTARLGAVQDVKKWIYTIDRYSNGADALRVMSPFIAASNNTVRTWAAIIGRKPQTLVYAYDLFQMPAKTGLIVNLDTGDVSGNKPNILPIFPNAKYGVVLPVPKFFKKLIGLDERFVLAPPITSFNLVLQGNVPLLPSTGPTIALPFAWFANKEPSNFIVQELGKYIFPSNTERGFFPKKAQIPQNPFKAVMPSWIRQWFNSNDESGTTRANATSLMLINQIEQKVNSGQSPYLTPQDIAEVDKKVDKLFVVKILGSVSLPFSTNIIDPRQQFLVNKYREYEKQGTLVSLDKDPQSPTFGQQTQLDATTRFINDFSPWLGSKNTAAAYTFSVTQNNAGINPTLFAQKKLDSYPKDFILEIARSNPKLIGLLVNDPSGKQDFNSAVYNWQIQNKIPGTIESYRGNRSAADAIDQTQVEEGYRQYIQQRQRVQALLNENNLTSITQWPALNEGFKSFVASLKAENPAFRNDINFGGSKNYPNTIQGLQTIISNPSVQSESNKNPNAAIPVKQLQQYIEQRQKIVDALPSNYNAGVLDSSQKYGALDDAWNAFVSGLINENPRFGEIYYRQLDGEFSRLENIGTAVN